MKTINYSELRSSLKRNLDTATVDNIPVLVKRPAGQDNAIIISEKEYNSIMETIYLFSSQANKDHLLKSIEEAKKGKGKKIKLDDLWK
jgi:antitoxin YefM